jgi:hypothetical protein
MPVPWGIQTVRVAAQAAPAIDSISIRTPNNFIGGSISIALGRVPKADKISDISSLTLYFSSKKYIYSMV